MRHIDNVIEANRAAAGTFFEKRTILYFKNKVHPKMYGGKYFISYDVMEDGQKAYAVREVLPSGLIKRVQNTTSKSESLSVIHDLLNAVTA